MKKYFFFDIDGTLAVGKPKRYIPKSTKKTIKKLIENGHFVAVATGRMYIKAVDFCDELKIKNMVCDGGNGIVIDDYKCFKPLDKEKMQRLLKELDVKKIPWGISTHLDNVIYSKYVNFKENMISVVTLKNYMNIKYNPKLDFFKYQEIYKGYVYIEKEKEIKIEALSQISYSRYNDNYIIIEQDDKSIGIKKVMDILNAPYSDVVVFGDNHNDKKMFLSEWKSIAMGNAVEELKEVADFITKDADKNGIEYACKKFGWIDK